MIAVEPHSQGAVLLLRAHPGARVNAVRGEQDGALKIYVTQTPERGKANKALIALLSKQLQVAKSRVQLLSGETSSRKRILITGLTADELRERLAALLP